SSRRRHTRCLSDWSSDVCSSDLGSEAAGAVETVGDGVTEVSAGDRVAYAMARGSYAEYAVVPSSQLVKIPDNVSFDTAAAVMLRSEERRVGKECRGRWWAHD